MPGEQATCKVGGAPRVVIMLEKIELSLYIYFEGTRRSLEKLLKVKRVIRNQNRFLGDFKSSTDGH